MTPGGPSARQRVPGQNRDLLAERRGQPHEVRKQEGVARLTGLHGSCVADSGPQGHRGASREPAGSEGTSGEGRPADLSLQPISHSRR